ncbi:MAG: DUF362 domain-containing protein [Deltaproteobacteria bacterium]|nr:DUF362 domain-containing protein [Deltaproteobacteria bacterium]MBW2086783.1 DUF362 domain-containing protein [Deltaproteobacteria bacterium]
MKSKVYACDMRAGYRENMFEKLGRLLDAVGLSQGIRARDLVAIKLHFGEKGNTGFVRPVFVRQVVDKIKSLQAQPFLTDANTLYGGVRNDSAHHLITAIENGFAFSVIQAPLIIADGLKGTAATEVKINLERIQRAYIATDIVEADALVSLAHFKGHELTGFGGTLKNLGMGCAARRGKLAQHSNLSPKVKSKNCDACGDCVEACAQSAISIIEIEKRKKARINPEKCIGCGECILVCPNDAIRVQWNKSIPEFMEKMAEYAAAVLKNKKGKAFLLNFLTQISPACDCTPHTDASIVRDVGILASTDPVAIDQASVDLVNQEPGLPGACPAQGIKPGQDKFRALYPKVDWSIQLEYGQKIGLGSRDYDLEWLKTK